LEPFLGRKKKFGNLPILPPNREKSKRRNHSGDLRKIEDKVLTEKGDPRKEGRSGWPCAKKKRRSE